MGMNKFTDIHHHEFRSTMLGLSTSDNSDDFSSIDYSCNTTGKVLWEFDWRKKGAVTYVKDQNEGQCGACWAFAATGALESQYFIHHYRPRQPRNLVSLSPQNLIDCARKTYHCYGCIDGHVEGALRYIKDNRGIDSISSYPYEGKTGQCRYNSGNNSATVNKVVVYRSTCEEQLKEVVSNKGPIVFYMKFCEDFEKYHSGVYSNPNCIAK